MEKGDDNKDSDITVYLYHIQPPSAIMTNTTNSDRKKYWCTQQLHFKVCALFLLIKSEDGFSLMHGELAMAENKTTHHLHQYWMACVCEHG